MRRPFESQTTRREFSCTRRLPVPFVERERHPATSQALCNFPEESAEQRTIEASTPAELLQELASFQRPAWVPELVEESSAPECSKFGGVPWLSRNESWPTCGQCGGDMHLFLQLNSAELPDQAREYIDGLLQVFVSTYETRSDACESFLAISNAALVRICQPSGPPGFSELPDPELYDEQHIVGWAKMLDLPEDRELQTMGVTLSDEQQAMQIDGVTFPIEGDKFHWNY